MTFFFSVKRIIDMGKSEWHTSGLVDGDSAVDAYKKAIKIAQEYIEKDDPSISINALDVFNKVEG